MFVKDSISQMVRGVFLSIGLLLAYNTTSCVGLAYMSGQKIDPELQPYVNMFLKEAHKNGYDLDLKELAMHIVYFRDPRESNDNIYTVAITYPEFYMGNPYIVFLPSSWYAMNRIQRELVVSHELAHAILGSNHYNGYTFLNGVPAKASIMNWIIINPLIFIRNRDYYYKELFTLEVDSATVRKFLKQPALAE